MPHKLDLSSLVPFCNSLKQYFPDSLKVYGLACSLINEKWKGFDFWVDQWPDYSAVVSSPIPGCCQAEYDNNVYSIFAKDNIGLEKLLHHPGIVDWKREILFGGLIYSHEKRRPGTVFGTTVGSKTVLAKTIDSVQELPVLTKLGVCFYIKKGVSNQHWDTIIKAAKFHGGHIVEPIEEVLTIVADEKDLPQLSTPDDVKVGVVSPELADTVSKNWDYGGSGSQDFIKNIIENFPSVCLFSPSGDIIGYELVYPQGSLGFLYVMPEFRRQGYGKLITTLVARKLLGDDKIPWAYVDKVNDVSRDFHKKLGFKEVSDGTVSWLRYKVGSPCSSSCSKQKCCI